VRRVAFIVIVGLAFLATMGCKGNNPTSPTTKAPVGTWQATRAEYVSVADPSKKVNLVSEGATVTLVLDASTFTFTIAKPGETAQVTTGSWSYTTDTMTLSPSGTSFTWVFELNVSQESMTLSGAHVEFNFSGTPEEAILTLVLYRA
jgi:hypothetical protein